MDYESLLGKVRQETAALFQRDEILNGRAAVVSTLPPQTVSPESTDWQEFPDDDLNQDFASFSPSEEAASYNVGHLLDFQDGEFVRRCYQVVLQREPEREGYEAFLGHLRHQRMDKLSMILALRQSPEGQKVNTKLKGLWSARARAALSNVPVMGSIVDYVYWLRNIPRLRQRIELLEAKLARTAARQSQTERSNPAPAIQPVVSAPPAAPSGTEEAGINFDQFYIEFEDCFRGSREEIKERQSVYLPLMRELSERLGPMPILDLACGRGEWLELLKGHGLFGGGVDINSASVAHCQSRQLNASQQDALSYLGDQADDSLLAVTAFHLIEHLPLATMLQLVDETLRVLIPGGIVIFETPNPSNLIVGAHTFYYDPTHRNPLPSGLMEFVLRQRGFTNVYHKPLHPYPDAVQLKGGEESEKLNSILFGSRDYAVIGTKR